MKKKTTNYALDLALAAGATTNKGQNKPKAKRICVGIDTALKSYQAARKVDNGAIGPVANLYSEQGLLFCLEKQCEQAEEVVVVYEAGPFGYVLY
jgi:hypothetical protein